MITPKIEFQGNECASKVDHPQHRQAASLSCPNYVSPSPFPTCGALAHCSTIGPSQFIYRLPETKGYPARPHIQQHSQYKAEAEALYTSLAQRGVACRAGGASVGSERIRYAHPRSPPTSFERGRRTITFACTLPSHQKT